VVKRTVRFVARYFGRGPPDRDGAAAERLAAANASANPSTQGSRAQSHSRHLSHSFLIVKVTGVGGNTSMTLSAREREYAAYLYSRPVGNTDPDNDPSGTVFLSPRLVR
jgi:hypothetical protein